MCWLACPIAALQHNNLSPYFRQAYTRVLQGHIGLATATFPDGTPGFMIDAFARRSLWEAGLDYQHGTGHGVGAALNVHEGPHVSVVWHGWPHAIITPITIFVRTSLARQAWKHNISAQFDCTPPLLSTLPTFRRVLLDCDAMFGDCFAVNEVYDAFTVRKFSHGWLIRV